MVRLALVGLLGAVAGCAQVDGGAVELSWKLRPSSSALTEKFVNCVPDAAFRLAGTVQRIRLDWEVIGRGTGFATWSCEDNHGVTSFEVPAGDALLSVSPECVDEQPPQAASFIAPAAVERQISNGGVASIGAIELVLNVVDCGDPPAAPCICQGQNQPPSTRTK